MGRSGKPSSSYVLILLLLLALVVVVDQCLAKLQCGRDVGGVLCGRGACCSRYGFCGTTFAYCGTGCQSQCSGTSGGGGGGGGGGVSGIVSSSLFDSFFNYRLSRNCPGYGFFTYSTFLEAAMAWPSFGTSGDLASQKRELAAFFANAHHETLGGCYKEEIDKSKGYCQPSAQWPCVAGKKYYGRGPLQITWNYNYGQAGKYLGFNGINDPDIVARDATISFKTAIWFWMTPQSPKPSCHDAMLNGEGFGKTIKIINGGECASPNGKAKNDRIQSYKSYCQAMGVDPGINLTC